MPLLVDVHPPPQAEPAPVEFMLQACSLAAPLSCQVRDPGAATKADAIVEWKGDAYEHARIWLTVKDGTIYRTLSFSESDRVEDRAAAVGLLLGSLVRESVRLDAQPPTVAEETIVPAEDDPEEPLSEETNGGSKKSPGSLSLLGVFGQGVTARGGARLELAVSLAGPLSVYGTGSVLLETSSPEEIRLQTFESGGGLGLDWFSSDLTWGGGLGFAFQEVRARLTQDGVTETGAIGRAGAEAFLGVGLLLPAHLALVLRGRTVVYPLAPKVFIGGDRAFALSPVEASTQMGLLVRF